MLRWHVDRGEGNSSLSRGQTLRFAQGDTDERFGAWFREEAI